MDDHGAAKNPRDQGLCAAEKHEGPAALHRGPLGGQVLGGRLHQIASLAAIARGGVVTGVLLGATIVAVAATVITTTARRVVRNRTRTRRNVRRGRRPRRGSPKHAGRRHEERAEQHEQRCQPVHCTSSRTWFLLTLRRLLPLAPQGLPMALATHVPTCRFVPNVAKCL